jgi:hypothetical protein
MLHAGGSALRSASVLDTAAATSRRSWHERFDVMAITKSRLPSTVTAAGDGGDGEEEEADAICFALLCFALGLLRRRRGER